MPLLCLHKQGHAGMVAELRTAVVPQLEKLGLLEPRVDGQPSLTLAFDCEGWSPELLRDLWELGIACVTWCKGQEALRPAGVEAALQAWDERGEAAEAVARQARQALEEARYWAQRAWLQFDDVDLKYPHVRSDLKELWEGRLEKQRASEERLLRLPAEREAYLALGADLERAWQHERATPALRRPRCGRRWRGLRRRWRASGSACCCTGRAATTANWRWRARGPGSIAGASTKRPWSLSDELIAGLLNRLGKRTAKGHGWTRSRVCSLRNSRDIAVYRAGEREERGELVLAEAAQRLGVYPWHVPLARQPAPCLSWGHSLLAARPADGAGLSQLGVLLSVEINAHRRIRRLLGPAGRKLRIINIVSYTRRSHIIS